MSIQQLREERAKIAAKSRQILDANPDKLSEEAKTQFDALVAEIGAIDDRIEREEKILALTADNLPPVSGRAEVVKEPPVYRNLGEQLLDVFAMSVNNADAPKARDRFQKVVNAATGASAGVDSEGGYLIETDKASSILTTAIETGVFSSRCTRQPISANADSFSYMAADDRDRSTGKRNGIDVYRKSETSTMSSSGKVTLKERELRVEDMYGMLYVTNRMLRDAPALAVYAQRCLREQLAWKLDYEIWQGNGAGQCLGIRNSDLPVSVAKESSQSAASIVVENIVKMVARFEGNIMNAAWFMNQDCLPQLPLMKIGDTPVFIPGGSVAGAPFGMLYGRPIVPVEFCATMGTIGDIFLGDFSQYLLIEKGGVEAAESIHVKFLNDEMAYRFIVRNNGQPMHDSPITPLNGSNTLSPFVFLATRP
jgi:HK97 family phage major capsid protein